MVKSRSTAAHSGHGGADKRRREKERREEGKRRKKKRRGRGRNLGLCVNRGGEGGGRGGQGCNGVRSQRMGQLSARAGLEWLGEPVPLVKPP